MNFSSKEQDNINNNIVEVAILAPIGEGVSEPDDAEEIKLNKEYVRMIKIGLADSVKTKTRVTTYDSYSAEKLNDSLKQILDSGVDIIIGPFDSTATKATAEKIKNKGIIAFSLSNNPVLAEKNMYIYGHAPMRQMEQLANYFLDNEYHNFIAVLPEGRYSNTINEILNEMIVSREAMLKTVFYEDSVESIENAIQKASGAVDLLNEDDFNLKQPVIILADECSMLKTLYDNIKKNNLDKKAVIAGDNRLYINYQQPIDIVFTGSKEIYNANIIKHARRAGIKHISFMHALAYDAGKMVGNNIGNNYNKSRFLREIDSEEGFTGMSGTTSFIDYIAQRKYDIISSNLK